MIDLLLNLIRENGIRKTSRDTDIPLRTIEGWLYKKQMPPFDKVELVFANLGYKLTITKEE
jgi:hypothetical protein